MEPAPGSRPSRGFVCGKKGEQDGGTAHRGPLPLSPVLEKCQHQPPSVQCKNVGAIVPLPLSAHTSFPSYRQRYCSQHPPSLGHPLDHFGISFPCFPTHDASGPFSNIPVHAHLFPPQGQSLQHLVLLLSSLAGQAGPHPPEGAGSWPSLAGGRALPTSLALATLPLPGRCTEKRRCCWDGRSAGHTASSRRQTCGALSTAHTSPSGCTWLGEMMRDSGEGVWSSKVRRRGGALPVAAKPSPNSAFPD